MEKTLKKQHTEEKNPLGYEPLSKLLKAYAIPSIIAMLVSSLYNIVDQIFIGQGVGYLGNAATNVSYPLVTICLAIALLIGIGGAARFSLELGAGNKEKAQQSTGQCHCHDGDRRHYIFYFYSDFSGTFTSYFWFHKRSFTLCHDLYQDYSHWYAFSDSL